VAEAPVLEGLSITLTTRHGGGCADHVFTAQPNPRSAEHPTTLTLDLHHDAQGDSCRALVTTPVTVSLEDLYDGGCLERITLRTWPSEDAEHTWDLPLKRTRGCE
jgi:hypothetical protein